MAVRGGVEVRLDDANLRRLVREFPDRAARFVAKLAFDIEATAKTLAPVDTGFLRNSIRAVIFGAAGIAGVSLSGRFEAAVVVLALYGIFVEFGSSRAGAKPYLTPALERVARSADNALKQLFPEAQ